MPRYFIEVAYKGTRYSGFQIQQNAVTVQSEVEQALATLHRHPFSLTGSSRTDAGVHASGQVLHFRTAAALTPQVWQRALNAVLPASIAVRWAMEVPDGFHARFSAISRSYRYTVWNDNAPTALLARYSYH